MGAPADDLNQPLGGTAIKPKGWDRSAFEEEKNSRNSVDAEINQKEYVRRIRICKRKITKMIKFHIFLCNIFTLFSQVVIPNRVLSCISLSIIVAKYVKTILILQNLQMCHIRIC